jgi:hypothetical protein
MTSTFHVPVTILDDAITHPAAIAATLRPNLKQHPVPQSDPRTRGLMMEATGNNEFLDLTHIRIPELCETVRQFAHDQRAIYVLAVNETPPTSPDIFFMRPHVDRRWLGNGFGAAPPRWTAVAFLDFPRSGLGGELVVFPRGAFDHAVPVAREEARATITTAEGRIIPPQPGRICHMAGDLPHAVLGYSAAESDCQRLALVLAEFAPMPVCQQV